MAKRTPLLLSALLAGCLSLTIAWTASAATIASLRADLNEFKKSGDARFAPKTVDRAQSYLGAAMLASERNHEEQKQEALSQASATLEEARQTAAGFLEEYGKLIDLADEARDTVEAVTVIMQAPQAGSESPQQMIKSGDRALDQAIVHREQGDLNKSQQLTQDAQRNYLKARDAAIPWLADLTEQELSRAIKASARNYAPILYRAAKDKEDLLLAYIQGKTRTVPDRPVEALYLAREAKHVAEQVKLWRKHSGSHEEQVLAARDFRYRLAAALGLRTEPNPLLANESVKPLLDAVAKLRSDLKRERKERDEERIALKQQYDAELQAALASQSERLTTAQHSQLSDIKEAFRAKLEKETFEQKRQAGLKKLFGKDDAQVFVNIDGSLLIRLTKLQFASGASKIDRTYYDLLGNLKEALKIYSDRQVRIEGHTDDTGDVKPNQVLSLKRAEAVRDFLIAAGSDGSHLKALGYGEVRPIASNEFPQGRAMNRRIDVIIEAPEK